MRDAMLLCLLVATGVSCSVAPQASATPDTPPPCPEAAVPSPAEPANRELPTREGFTVAEQGGNALNSEAVHALVERARSEHSTSLIVVVDGALVVEEYFGSDPERATIAMSASKSVVALAVGKLVDDGLLDLDAPLGETLVSEWKGTPRSSITARQMLRQMSGLSTERYGQSEESREHGSIEAQGLQSSVAAKPGTQWVYNNNISDFLGVLVQRADAEHNFLDDYLRIHIFGKLGFGPTFWIRDRVGQPRAAGELFARPIDLTKLGQLVLDQGRWQGEQILSEAWISQMLSPAPGAAFYGLLWWRRGDAEQVLAYEANGYLGQYIVVIPTAKIVAVRTRDPRLSGDNPEEFTYGEFVWDVLALAGHAVPEEDRNRFARNMEAGPP